MTSGAELKRTPLHSVHCASGAKMVDFGGWSMPVQYSSILDEHSAVRNAVGIFDVSHMGEIDVHGPEAVQFLDYVATNSASRLKEGQVQYSALLYEHGGFVDDILVHKVADDRFFLCVNASNQEKDFQHIQGHNRFNAKLAFLSDRYAQIAIQGPKALDTLQKLTPLNLSGIRYYWFLDGTVSGTSARVARTGYPARMDLRSTSLRTKRREFGQNCLRPAKSSELNPADWARATRYDSKPKWLSTATN